MNLHGEHGDIPSNPAIILADAHALYQSGRIHEAIAACQKVLALDPASFDAIHLLGKAANQIGQRPLAENFLRAALTLRPDSAEALSDLGQVLMLSGMQQQALDCFARVLEIRPGTAKAHFDVATALFDLGRMDEAMQHCEAAISFQPDLLSAHVRLGMIHYKQDDLHRSLASFNRAHLISPGNIDVLNLLALNEIALGRPDEALPFLDQVLLQSPGNDFATARKQEALAYMQDHAPAREALYNAGLIDAAEAMARDDLSKENSVENHNFLLKCYLASNRHSAFDYFQESRDWSRLHAHEELLPLPGEFNNDRNPDRRLKVGIVGDYFVGVIGAHTLYPFFKLYDREKLEMYCYNFGPGEETLRPVIDHYRDIRHMSGEDFFALVRNDAIDIMLDINGRIRTPNYFETLLKQPAPIQVNWYNLPCTVGVKAYNYAIADEYCVRKGEEDVFVEKIFRMKIFCPWDFGPPPPTPRPPFESNEYVTFGCFGDFFKVNETVLATWADLLGHVPHARLYLKSNNLRLASERERVSEFFRQRGIDPKRLILEGVSTYNQMKKCYEWVDIALDNFPYSSGSTTINALWHGVPVITIEGSDWRGRTTATLLTGLGLERFIAKDASEYIAIAAKLADDPAQLIDLRAGLGRHLAASPLFNVREFSRNFESTLRMMWHDWLKVC